MIEIAIEKRLASFTLDARLEAPDSGITALFGRSGAGKTTVINALAGLLRPDRGRIAIGGETVFDSARGIDLPPERRRLGYVFQEGRLFPHYSVRGNLLYGAKRGETGPSFDAVVDLLGIKPLLARRPADLSGGEKQRVAIGRALLASPRLLLMDEPLASLDAPRKGEILPFIERLRDELRLPVFYVSHEMDEIIRLADLLVILDDGKVAASGSVEELTSRLDLWPLTGRHEAGSVVRTTLRGHDTTFGLSELAFPGGRLRVTRLALPLGTPIRVRIRARDVVLATERPAHLSIRNAFAGKVVEVAVPRGPLIDLKLDIGTPEQPVMLWARVTQRALQELQLAPGKPVFALVKTVALDRHSYGRFASGEAEAL
ncbi:MAG TPA: molybdenum ABC transporter ATP-binding protein [Stellaceae bacterium]|nr:molybdenum ABC transporter ATP-binding protein [Stellaceae bacterium]